MTHLLAKAGIAPRVNLVLWFAAKLVPPPVVRSGRTQIFEFLPRGGCPGVPLSWPARLRLQKWAFQHHTKLCFNFYKHPFSRNCIFCITIRVKIWKSGILPDLTTGGARPPILLHTGVPLWPFCVDVSWEKKPDSSVSQWVLIALKFLWKNIEKQKS